MMHHVQAASNIACSCSTTFCLATYLSMRPYENPTAFKMLSSSCPWAGLRRLWNSVLLLLAQQHCCDDAQGASKGEEGGSRRQVVKDKGQPGG